MIYDPSFYLAASFVLFLVSFGRPFYRKMKARLESHGKEIETQIQEVKNLYEEAVAILEEKEKELDQLEEKIKVLEIEGKKRVSLIQREQKESLENLETLFEAELKQEKENLKNDVQSSIQKALLEKGYQNLAWILENKLTKLQKETINTAILEKL